MLHPGQADVRVPKLLGFRLASQRGARITRKESSPIVQGAKRVASGNGVSLCKPEGWVEGEGSATRSLSPSPAARVPTIASSKHGMRGPGTNNCSYAFRLERLALDYFLPAMRLHCVATCGHRRHMMLGDWPISHHGVARNGRATAQRNCKASHLAA